MTIEIKNLRNKDYHGKPWQFRVWRLNAPKLSDYDCTGQTFAIDIKGAHMTGNRFKVFGYMTVDV